MATLLLIEPDESLASTYKDALQYSNHEVHHSVDIRHAIQALDERQIDLIILELQIALHNGVEFLYEMRSYTEWQHIPVILHTSVPFRALNQGDVLSKELNVQVHLYKPTTSLEKLTSAVESELLAHAS